jgi:hypothetical protein
MSYLCVNKPALDMHMSVFENNLRLNKTLICMCLIYRRAFYFVPTPNTVEQN